MGHMTLTQIDLDQLEERLSGVFATKKEIAEYKSSLMDKLDKILKEILSSREEQTVLAHQVSGHEDRIQALEVKSAS